MKLLLKRLTCLITIIFAVFLFCQSAYATATYEADLYLRIDSFDPSTVGTLDWEFDSISNNGTGVFDANYLPSQMTFSSSFSEIDFYADGFAGDGVNSGYSNASIGAFLTREFTTESSVTLSFDLSGDYTLGISRDYSAFEEAFAIVTWDLLIDDVSYFDIPSQVAYSHTGAPDVQGPNTSYIDQRITKTIDQPGYHTIRLEGYVSGWASADYPQVPEPSTMLLLGFGLVGLAGVRFRKKR